MWYELLGSRIDLGERPALIGMFIDITARRRAEEALLASERRFRTLLEEAPLAIGIGRSGLMMYGNRKFREIFGFKSASDVEGWPILEAWAPEDRPRIAERARQREAGLPAPPSFEARGLRRDGTRFPARVVVADVQLPDGPATIAFHADITEQESLELQLRQAQKMEAIGQLAGGVAHDFNNLLAVILSYASLAMDEIQPSDPLHAELLEIEKAAKRAAALTAQLLAFSRRQVLQPRVCDLRDIVSGTENMLRRLIGADIVLATRLSARPARVLADAGQLEQVLVNLAVNARDAMPEGGRLGIEIARAKISAIESVRLDLEPGDYCTLAVADTGTGMDAATRARIFEPFFTTKEVGKGTGLGLSTVFGIVRQSGGQITVDSEVGRGTTFRLWLPATDAMQERPTEADREVDVSGSETILLVEDEDAVRALASTILTRKGYRVLEARSGGDALVVAEAHPGDIDLVLTDVVMPHMRGDHLAARLVATRPGLRVAFMSGSPDRGIGEHVLAASAAFIPKPFTPELLLQRVREVLATGRPDESRNRTIGTKEEEV